jgi:ketosteroid isomerase-like protein
MYIVPIRQAVRQIERWMYAATQDRHPGIAMLHANYAVGDIDMLRQMYPDDLVWEVSGRHPIELLRQATAAQDRATRDLARLCPGVAPAWPAGRP